MELFVVPKSIPIAEGILIDFKGRALRQQLNCTLSPTEAGQESQCGKFELPWRLAGSREPKLAGKWT
jgi:Fe-S cluster assembly iron-binding protein IscA